MGPYSNKVKRVVLLLIFFVVCAVAYYIRSFLTSKRIVVFCDVGQGNATLIQIYSTQVLIDTGPNESVLSCLGSYMYPFDTTIEYCIITHPDADHKGGLSKLLSRYTINTLYSTQPLSNFPGSIVRDQEQKQIYIKDLIFSLYKASSGSRSRNESSIVVSVVSPKQLVFLTGDIDSMELARLIPQQTTILQVPHHGSKQALTRRVFALAHPRVAVISVGKNNRYGHPSEKTLDILKAKNIPILRTDIQGDIVFAL